MDNPPETIRAHLKNHGNWDAAIALRNDPDAGLRFIRSCLPDGPSAVLYGYVVALGWDEVARRIFDVEEE